MTPKLSKEDYRDLTGQVRHCVGMHVPPGAVVLIVSKGDEELLRLDDYRPWHFPRSASGTYAGHYPADSVEALTHLRRLFAQGAQYLVFPWTALWWLDHYRELLSHLNSSHRLVATQKGVCLIYELVESPAFDAFDASQDADDALEDTDAELEVLERLSVTPRAVRGPLRVLTILVRFGTTQYPNAKENIDEIFRRQMPTVERRTIVVDNALPRDTVLEQHDSVVIGGDNSAREFSAFDRALEFAGSDIWSYDFVHFATSAFNTMYVSYIERFNARLLEILVDRPACVGHIDCYNEPVDVRTYRSQHWMRSCFFFLPPAEAKALGSFVSVSDGARFFSGDAVEPFRRDAPLSGRYRQYITDWLTGGDIGQGVEWHSSFALSADTLPEFEHKTRAILNEHLAAVRLRALGCHLVDVTWLSTMLQLVDPIEIRLDTPWREQLASRDRDAITLRQPWTAPIQLAG
jgi:hypothetical protein